MTTDENILEEMLERVTNANRDNADNLAVQMFCMIVQSNSGLVTKAHDLIVKKLHSENTTEAARAIGLLEECMSKGGVEFQKKTAKFTFLNELIALVLDKQTQYWTGSPAKVETKKRIMECLMLWTVEHQDKPKIQEAYDNLKKQVNFQHGPSVTITGNSPSSLANTREQRSSILGKDEDLVAKLLKQGGEENYKKANLLIQHRFNQEARRTEFICHLKSELKKIEDTMELLEQMLNSYSSDVPGGDSRDIMQELYNTCKGHNEQMARWPDFLGDGEPEFLEDVLNTKDLLMVVLQRYKELFETEVSNSKSLDIETIPKHPTATSNIAPTTTTNSDLLSELLGDTIITSNPDTQPILTSNTKETNDGNKATMDELSEIFGNISDNKKTVYPNDLLGNIDLLKPISVTEKIQKNANETTTSSTKNDKQTKKAQGFMELKEIDKLSEDMFKQSLKEEQRLLSFKKEPEKITLNDLAKDKIQTSLLADNRSEKTSLKTKEEINEVLTTTKYLIVDLKNFKDKENHDESLKSLDNAKEEKSLELNNDCETTNSVVLKPLAEISVDLDEVIPLDEGQRLLSDDDDDIQVTLNFTADRPSQNVSVIVMAVTNKSKLPVKDFQFEASVKKPCKVRLLPPTDINMAPSKPFRPAAPINQVILLLNPTKKPVDLTCIVGYKLGDDPDPIKVSFVAKDIPYV